MKNKKYEYIVSSCLAGIKCRYDGSNKKDDYVTSLVKEGKAICVCPEVLGGLSIPREPSEIVNDKVITKSGCDVTDNYYKGSLEVLKIAKKHNIKKAILKDKSPACGMCRYDGTFSGKLINKPGVTTKLLMDNDIEIISK
jgi:uncharacterized protein YbbK (DUF523 family)